MSIYPSIDKGCFHMMFLELGRYLEQGLNIPQSQKYIPPKYIF